MPRKNKVILLGTIHGNHHTQKSYSLKVLKEIVSAINPDIILAEMPPTHFIVAMEQYKKNKFITESRISNFPEYVDVIIPLANQLKYEMIPVAAWTEKIDQDRSAALQRIQTEPQFRPLIQEYNHASQLSKQKLSLAGDYFDPAFIHTDTYDDLIAIETNAYDRLFSPHLGAGGWQQINQAHYQLISDALDHHAHKGLTMLITFGAGHKGYIKNKLNIRRDIIYTELLDAL